MAINTPLQLVQYYQSLLIYQYLNKPNASGTIGVLASMATAPQTTIQTIAFSPIPTSGSFVLSYNGINTATIQWNATAATIQSDLQAVTGLGSVTVTGSISGQLLTVTFIGVPPPAQSLEVESNLLMASAVEVEIAIVETDLTLPLAINDGFNLIAGTPIAIGAQLDIIGKYCGVTRSGQGITSYITLDDADFLSLIRIAIVQNSSGSSLSDIQAFLQMFFAGEIYVFDYRNMKMTYIISQTVGSPNLVQLVITENLLPVPMAVDITSIFYPPTANMFAFRTYELPDVNGEPFNSYADYHTNWPWLSYQFLITP